VVTRTRPNMTLYVRCSMYNYQNKALTFPWHHYRNGVCNGVYCEVLAKVCLVYYLDQMNICFKFLNSMFNLYVDNSTKPYDVRCITIGQTVHWTRMINLDVHGSVHRNINLIERTNKMRQCSRIYYFNVS